MPLHFDIIVAGAGPAGATFVLSMLDAPYSIAVIDKAVFPRDKVCGDAIPGRAVRVLESMSPQNGPPTITSPYPSPFTSPAEPTAAPKSENWHVRSSVRTQWGEPAGPVAAPRYTEIRAGMRGNEELSVSPTITSP